MVTNDKFIIKNLKYIVLLGYQKTFNEIKKFNDSLKIKSLIVTSPDQKKKFDKNTKVHSFKQLDKNFKKFIREEVEINKTLFISIGSRWIFSKSDIKKFFNNNLVNFHGTRLPFDKGGAFISWQILKNNRIENQMVHLLNSDIDAGPVLMNDNSIYPATCKTPLDYEGYYNSRQLDFYKKFIKKIKNNDDIYLRRQVDYIGSYNPRLNTDISGWINWNISSDYLYRFINAFDDPYKGAMTYINNEKVRIKSVHLHGGEFEGHPFSTGLVSRHDKKWLVVSTIDQNMILIEKVINKNNKNIIDKIRPGERFYTPSKNIDYAFSKKIKYNSMGLNK